MNDTPKVCRFIPDALVSLWMQRTGFSWYWHSKAFDKYLSRCRRSCRLEILTTVEDLADAVEPVRALCSAGVDVLRVHCGASFMNSGYKTHDASVQTSSI